MLKAEQADQVAWGSLTETLGSSLDQTASEKTLQDLGVKNDQLDTLAIRIASDPSVGVTRWQHYLNLNQALDEITLTLTVNGLSKKIMELSTGKLCSNPTSPHEQQCCPYPSRCPQCGYPVR